MSFSMISPYGQGFADSTSGLLGFANRWNTAINQGQQVGNRFLANTITGNQLATKLNDMGSENMLADMQRSEAMLQTGVDQLENQRQGQLLQCILSGSQSPECQALYRTVTGQQLPSQPTQNMSVDPAMRDYSMSPTLRNYFGL